MRATAGQARSCLAEARKRQRRTGKSSEGRQLEKQGYEHDRASQNRTGSQCRGRSRMVGQRAVVSHRSAQRDAPRHLAVSSRGICHDGRRDSDVRVLRDLSLDPRYRLELDCELALPALRSGMTDVATKNWYIVHTYSGFEKKVAESL